jgi:hypothetical protein
MACGPQRQWGGQTRSRRLAETNVRYWHKADMLHALTNVRFEGKNGHDADVTRCVLMTQSGHAQCNQDAI